MTRFFAAVGLFTLLAGSSLARADNCCRYQKNCRVSHDRINLADGRLTKLLPISRSKVRLNGRSGLVQWVAASQPAATPDLLA